MTLLVLLEAESGHIRQPCRCALAAAALLPGPVHALVTGTDADAAAAAALPGIDRVLHAPLAHALAEPLASLIVSLAPAYTHILAASTTAARNAMPRAAALLDSQIVSDVSAIEAPDVFVRPVYAGNALARIRSADPIRLLTIRAASFDPVADTGGTAPIETLPAPAEDPRARFVSAELTHSERPELAAARIVVSGGRGLGNAENFALLDPIADALGAAIGASRAAVDAGYAANDMQVGQTGKVVAPDLYLAIGISGAIQHLAGMKDSKVIVAINKDADAPIFQVADYGLVADLFEVLPQLQSALTT